MARQLTPVAEAIFVYFILILLVAVTSEAIWLANAGTFSEKDSAGASFVKWSQVVILIISLVLLLWYTLRLIEKTPITSYLIAPAPVATTPTIAKVA